MKYIFFTLLLLCLLYYYFNIRSYNKCMIINITDNNKSVTEEVCHVSNIF